MGSISLRSGLSVTVDDNLFPALNQWKWHCRNKRSKAIVRELIDCGKRKYIYLARLIIGEPPAGMVIDHINRNPLDNRKENLRFATISQNNANRTITSSTGIRGVDYRSGRWRAKIVKNRKVHYLGWFDNQHDAATAYDLAAAKLHGEFAITNY